MSDTKTPEMLAEEKRLLAEQKAEEKRLKKEADDAAKAEKKRLAEEERKRKADEKAAKKVADAAAKEAAKAASEMPESNGIRRPKAGTACGNAWAIFDAVSGETGAPATMGEVLRRGLAANLNEATIRTQYARWRKFFGISGRLADPAAEAAKAEKVAAKELEKANKKAEADRKKAEKEAEKLAKKEADALAKAEAEAAKNGGAAE